MTCPKCGHECPKCGTEPELASATEHEDDCCNSHEDEADDAALESIGSAPITRDVMRVSANRALIIIGCILLVLSLNFSFISSPSHSWGSATTAFFAVADSGFSLIFGIRGFGFNFNHANFIELLVPIVAVAALTVLAKKINNSRLIVVGVSFMGLYFGLSRMSGLMRGGPFSMMTPGIGLIIFVWLWVLITVLSIFEYKDIHVFEKALVRRRESV